MLERITRLTWAHPRKILAVAGVFAVVAGVFGINVEHHLQAAGFVDPASQSDRAAHILDKALGHSAEAGEVILLRAKDGGRLDLNNPTVQNEIGRLAAGLKRSRYVGQVVGPLPAQDGQSALLAAELTTTDLENNGGLADDSIHKNVKSQLLDVRFTGYAPSFNEVNDQTRNDLTTAELIAFPILTLLLLLVFRSAVAAGIPLLIGVLSILGTFLMLRIMSSLVATSLFALNISTALSLGLAVDYALLIVSRYRRELDEHGATFEAHRRTVLTAGRTSMFSGLTVAGAMLSLTLMPQRFLYSVGAAGACVGVLSALMALFVVPALLAVLGPNINKLTLRKGPSVSDVSGRWMALARGVMRRPVLVSVVTAGALLGLAVPVLGTTLTGPSAQAVPPGQPAYEPNAYVFAHYGREVTEPVTVLVHGAASDAQLAALRTRIAALPHVATTTPALRANGAVAYLSASLDAPALAKSSQAVVHAIRRLQASPGSHVLVAGNAARFIDEKHSLTTHAPLVLGLIIVLTTILLFLLTGSVILPIKTLLMTGLTLAATLGVLVIVFQHGFLAGLLDYPGPDSVEVTSLVFLFAVTFALATDYAVLVMASIKELRDSGMSNTDAVAHGVARTGRIISAAALMIAVVFMAFGVSPVFFMKQLSLGIAFGVIIDATIVRGLLVPSLMRLLGEWNWWAPKPLRRVYTRFGISEGTEPAAA